ncbi:MAG: SDR family NAD(P)-dependent oxidoreductase [Pararhizobium sp.]
MGDETVLITGASGFIGKHLAREFLAHGYRVRGTVREAARGEALRETLARHVEADRFEAVVADLLSDEGWEAAVRGVAHVVHAASPFPIAQPKDPATLVRPAVDGTMRVLEAAERAGCATFVQTSSTAAIYPGHGARTTPYTAEDWAVLGSPAATPYVLSKTLSERTARDHVAQGRMALRYMTVNPAFVLGPLLDRRRGSSVDVVRMLLKGRYPAVPRLQMGVVDVRDVATIHRLAIEKGRAGGRYIAAAGSLWLREVSAILRQDLGEKASKAPTRQLPDALVRLVGLFDARARAIVTELGKPTAFDASVTMTDLGVRFTPPGEAVAATGRSLLALGLV